MLLSTQLRTGGVCRYEAIELESRRTPRPVASEYRPETPAACLAQTKIYGMTCRHELLLALLTIYL